MASEEDVIRFLKERGEATIEEVSSALKIPKYGPLSAYAILYSLKSRNIVERRGSRWALVVHGEGAHAPPSTKAQVEEAAREGLEAGPAIDRLTPPQRAEGTRDVGILKTQTILDRLFFGFDGKPLGGIPISSQLIIAGPLGAGKSLLVSEVAIKAAHSGHRVLYSVLDDVWRAGERTLDLQSRMMLRSKALEFSWEKILKNLVVVNPRGLGEEFLREYEASVSGRMVDLAIIDPVNMLEGQVGGGGAERILIDMADVNRSLGVTGIFVAHAELRGGASTGLPGFDRAMFLMDGVIEVAPVEVTASGLNISATGLRQLRAIRVARCRLCCFEEKYLLFSIAPSGLIREVEV